MDQPPGNERGQLATIVILLLFPTFFWIVFSLLNVGIPADAAWRDWIFAPSYLASVLLLVLPFLWKDSLSFKCVIGRVFQKSNWATIGISLVPAILFVSAVIRLAQDPHTYSYFGLPAHMFDDSPFRTHNVLSIFLVSGSAIVGLVLIANAAKLGDRVLFFALRFGIGIVFALIQFAINWNHVTSQVQLLKYMSPLPALFEMLGSFMIICGLMRLGRNSVQAVAIFLLSMWAVRLMGITMSPYASLIAFGGGGILILVATYVVELNQRLRTQSEQAST